MARAREVAEIDCDDRFALAAARVIEVRAEEVFEHSGEVLDTHDTEHVHDMRVTTRRLRAALEVFGPCFPRKRYRPALKALKELADALGERRDRDVSIEFLGGFLDDLPAGDRGRLEILLARLRQEQRDANKALAPFLTDRRLDSLRVALGELVEAARR